MTRLQRAGIWTGWSLIVIAYAAVFRQQLQYGIEYDESTSLNVINNIATGFGYATTGLSWGWYVPFDPGASTGPALLLPSAFMWWATDGSLMWARLIPLALFMLLPVSLGLIFSRNLGKWPPLVAAASPLALAVDIPDLSSVSLVPGRFIGEFVGAAFLATMALFLQRRRMFVAGIFGGLAVMTKFNFLFPAIVGMAAWWLFFTWLDQSSPSPRRMLSWLGGFASPILAFELFKFVDLGYSDWFASSKAYAAYLMNQGGNYPTDPLSEKLPERLASLLETISAPSLILLLLILFALALRALSPLATDKTVLPPGVVVLSAASVAILMWWLLSAPQDSARLGIPALLLGLPVVLVAGFHAVFQREPGSLGRAKGAHRTVATGLALLGLFTLAYQAVMAITNDFGSRLMADQVAAARAILDSETPSLPNTFIWHLGQFQLLTGIPTETKPGVAPPTVEIYDSIRARVDTGIDDARELTGTCGTVLFSSPNAVVCKSASP